MSSLRITSPGRAIGGPTAAAAGETARGETPADRGFAAALGSAATMAAPKAGEAPLSGDDGGGGSGASGHQHAGASGDDSGVAVTLAAPALLALTVGLPDNLAAGAAGSKGPVPIAEATAGAVGSQPSDATAIAGSGAVAIAGTIAATSAAAATSIAADAAPAIEPVLTPILAGLAPDDFADPAPGALSPPSLGVAGTAADAVLPPLNIVFPAAANAISTPVTGGAGGAATLPGPANAAAGAPVKPGISVSGLVAVASRDPAAADRNLGTASPAAGAPAMSPPVAGPPADGAAVPPTAADQPPADPPQLMPASARSAPGRQSVAGAAATPPPAGGLASLAGGAPAADPASGAAVAGASAPMPAPSPQPLAQLQVTPFGSPMPPLAPAAGSGNGAAGSGSDDRSAGRFAQVAAGDMPDSTAAAALSGGEPAAAPAQSTAAAPGVAVSADPAATIADQVSSELVRLASSGTREMVMRLRPPELGDLTVRVAVSGRDVSAWFESAQPQVQAAISDGIGQLHADLGNAGFNLSGAWVGADASNARQQGSAPPPPLPMPPAAAAEPSGFATLGVAVSLPSTSRVSIYV